MNNKGLVFIGIGFELMGIVLAALIIGEKLDKYYGKNGVFVIIFLICGFISWTFHFVFLLKRMMNDDDEGN